MDHIYSTPYLLHSFYINLEISVCCMENKFHVSVVSREFNDSFIKLIIEYINKDFIQICLSRARFIIREETVFVAINYTESLCIVQKENGART